MKILRFTRVENDIFVEYDSTLRNANNTDENFRVNQPTNIDSYLENKLFYHFDRKKWTLNEIIFFANNNRLCLSILEQGVEIKRYAACGDCFNGFQINTQCFRINNNFLII